MFYWVKNEECPFQIVDDITYHCKDNSVLLISEVLERITNREEKTKNTTWGW